MPLCMELGPIQCACVFSGHRGYVKALSASPCYSHLSFQPGINMACKQPCGQKYVSTVSSPSCVVEFAPKLSPAISWPLGVPAAKEKNYQGRGRLEPGAPLLLSLICEQVKVQQFSWGQEPEDLSSRPPWYRFPHQESHAHLSYMLHGTSVMFRLLGVQVAPC